MDFNCLKYRSASCSTENTIGFPLDVFINEKESDKEEIGGVEGYG